MSVRGTLSRGTDYADQWSPFDILHKEYFLSPATPRTIWGWTYAFAPGVNASRSLVKNGQPVITTTTYTTVLKNVTKSTPYSCGTWWRPVTCYRNTTTTTNTTTANTVTGPNLAAPCLAAQGSAGSGYNIVLLPNTSCANPPDATYVGFSKPSNTSMLLRVAVDAGSYICLQHSSPTATTVSAAACNEASDSQRFFQDNLGHIRSFTGPKLCLAASGLTLSMATCSTTATAAQSWWY